MGLDLGGGGVRCLLIDLSDAAVTTAVAPWRPSPAAEVPLGHDYAPEATWDAVARVAREALARAGDGAAKRVLAVAATSVRHGSALLDAAGETLLLTPNLDARGTGVAFALGAERGAAIHASSGHWPHPIQPACRLRWCAEHTPQLLDAASSHLALSDWLAFRLSGEIATEASQACETALLQIDRARWSDELIDALQLTRRLFPELRVAGSRLGSLLPAAADALGLPAGIPVATAGADTQCGLLGVGVVEPGQLGIVAGTSAPVLQIAAHPTLDPEARQWTVHHLLEGRWALESNAGAVGDALAWVASLLFPERHHAILHLLASAAKSPAGNAGFLSTFGVEVMDARRLQIPLGSVTLNALSSAGETSAQHHFARALLEGIGFGLRANIDQIVGTTGEPGTSVFVTGGLTRSPVFTQQLADALDRPVRVGAVTEASALGAALCAGVGASLFADLPEAASALVRFSREHEPSAESRAVYADLYPRWCDDRAGPSDAASAAVGIAANASMRSGAAQPPISTFRPRILVTADLDDASVAALREIGDVEYQSFRDVMRLLTGPSLAKALEGVHVLITEIDVVDAGALLAAPDLRVIGVCRGDAVNVDLDACAALGIPVFNTPARNADAVADLTLAFLLGLARRLPAANRYLREPGGKAGDMGRMGRAFSTLQGAELWGKTVGLVGLGAVGRKVVERLTPFGARCLAYDPHVSPDRVRLSGAEPVELDELLSRSDYVSLHAAVTEETQGLIGAAELARMPTGAGLVNTARAALVDEAALLAALESGALGGAALDVFAIEPPAWDARLLQLDNVIATPHIGGNTREVAAHQGRVVVDELSRLASCRPLRHGVGNDAPADFDWARPHPTADAELAERLRRAAAPAVTDLQRDGK